MKGILISCTLIIISFFGYSQTESLNTDYKLGIKTAINLSTFSGTELENPRLRFGYSAGAYFWVKLNKNYRFQSELLANFKGSNFNNADDEYSRITTFYMDLPLLFGYEVAENQLIYIGPQLGYLALSSMYIGKLAKPHENGLPLKPFSIEACAVYQSNGKLMGLQGGVKLGLLNINDGINFVNVNPPTGNNGVIRSISLELGMLF